MTENKNLLENICFKRGYLNNQSLQAWTKYEVCEEENYYQIGVLINTCFFTFPNNKQINIMIHELTHCAFYQMHAEGLINDEEAIALNETLDDNFPTLCIIQNKTS